MKLHKFTLRILLVGVALAAANIAAPAQTADKWLRIQTKNFQLVGNADEKNMRGVATRLEQFGRFSRSFFRR
jgi:hypothetical protein